MKSDHGSTEELANTAVTGVAHLSAEPQLSPMAEKAASFSGTDHDEEHDDPGHLRRRIVYTGGAMPTRKASRAPSFTSMLESTRPIPPSVATEASAQQDPCPAETSLAPNPLIPMCSRHGIAFSYHEPAEPELGKAEPTFRSIAWNRFIAILKSFRIPATISIAIAIPCSVALPLKALFTPVEGWTGTVIPVAPDGNPPLAFVLDTTSSIGGLVVPSQLILLGAAVARLKVSHDPASLVCQPLTCRLPQDGGICRGRLYL